MTPYSSDFILVAIGANLPGPDGAAAQAICKAAAEALRSLPGLRSCAQSRWYATSPMPVSDQPDFVNGAVRLAGTVSPAELLATLHGIEAAAGRRRSVPNAARTLDLDLIAIGDLRRTMPDPILPHPRAHLRPFVLAPLIDIAPQWVHPVLGRTAAEMLSALPSGAAGGVLRVL